MTISLGSIIIYVTLSIYLLTSRKELEARYGTATAIAIALLIISNVVTTATLIDIGLQLRELRP